MNNKLFAAVIAGTLALASCGNNEGSGTNDELVQAKIDSAVQARMEEMQAQLAAQNDSLINALAMQRADSMMAAARAAGNNNTGMSRTVPTTRNARTTAPATSTPRTNDVRTGGFGSQSDANKAKDKTTVEGGGFGSQSDKSQSGNRNTTGGGGFGSQADR